MVQCSDSVCEEEKENHFYSFQMHTSWKKNLWHLLHFKNSFPVQAGGPMHSTESLKDYCIINIIFAI